MSEFSKEETAAIKRLLSLAKKWPKSLVLFAGDGSVHVLKREDVKEGLDLDEIGVYVDGITGDGGQGDL